jgi:hypothetical protein
VVISEAAEEYCVVDASLPRMVKLSTYPLAGQRRRFCGSKFWPLADELSSDEEVDERCSEEEETDYWSPGVSIAMGVSSGDDHTAEETCAVEEQQGRAFKLAAKVCSSYCYAGQGGRSADRMADAVAARRLAPKPWHGPLPAARRSPRMTLGDVLAKATKASLRKGDSKRVSFGAGPVCVGYGGDGHLLLAAGRGSGCVAFKF